MAKRRVYEIAKDNQITSKELIEKLTAAGIEAKSASSSVDEAKADKALGKAPAPKKKQESTTKSSDKSPSKAAPARGRRRVVIDSKASSKRPGGPGGQQSGGPQQRKTKRGSSRKKREVLEAEREAAAAEEEVSGEIPVVKINSGSTVKEVSEYLDIPIPEIITKLMKLGEMATLTQTLSDEVLAVLGDELEREIEVVHVEDDDQPVLNFEDSDEELASRPPVVTIMGHVDHGKTSLLDAVRETEVASGEAGGITQHIGAYQVHHGDKAITFLDTPGHQAFTAMRARGAKVTDIAIIVVAADDGVKPQTEEALDHAKAAEVPIIVAVNKIDKPAAKPDQIRTQLSELGFQPEDWGGDTVFVDVSAKTKEGLDTLLDMILLVTELEELTANPNAPASGTVVESKLDPGRGPVATVLIQRGTLNVSDGIVAGPEWGRVRAMHDFLGHKLDRAIPGDPVEILGFNGVPQAGEFVQVVESERKARQQAADRATRLKAETLARKSNKHVTLDDVSRLVQRGEMKDLNLVLKADVAGSLEAIEDEISKLPQDEITVTTVHKAVGGINESDVMLAAASDGLVIGFNVRPVGNAAAVAEREGVEIRTYSIIYKALEELRAAMSGMLDPEDVEKSVAQLEVRDVFKASKVGTIAGCYVTDGTVTRGDSARLVRDGKIVYEGSIASLRRFKDDVKEVASGYECGVILKDFMDVKEADILEIYQTHQVERELA